MERERAGKIKRGLQPPLNEQAAWARRPFLALKSGEFCTAIHTAKQKMPALVWLLKVLFCTWNDNSAL